LAETGGQEEANGRQPREPILLLIFNQNTLVVHVVFLINFEAPPKLVFVTVKNRGGQPLKL